LLGEVLTFGSGKRGGGKGRSWVVERERKWNEFGVTEN